jgi:competence protein ComEC
MAVLFMLFLLHLGWEYRNYTEFITKPFYFTHAAVLNAYTKHTEDRSYQVLKLKCDNGMVFYTTTHRKRDLSRTRLRLQLFPSQSISFWEYLGVCYIKSRIKKVEPVPEGLRKNLADAVNIQHEDHSLQALYRAIFFAVPLPGPLRETISQLGISHLVALSGLHLTILWGVLYGMLWLLYQPLQQRYFPYRYALVDLGVVTLAGLGCYVWFVGMPPSLVRAFAMVGFGWLVLVMGVELLSFTFLAVVIALLLVCFPALLVSLGFWFSVAGVFYIFLLLHYMKAWHKWLVALLILPLGIFVLMQPVVHLFFPVTSRCQLLSPLLSLLFTPFYPLSLLLHLIGAGGLFDLQLAMLLQMPCSVKEILLPWWAGVGYVILSIGAVFNRRVFVLLLAAALWFVLQLYI